MFRSILCLSFKIQNGTIKNKTNKNASNYATDASTYIAYSMP